jgi:hypothetical protein
MSRFRKPFFKKSHDCWYVQIEGRQIRLSKDRDEAFLLYHKMMINWYRFRRQSVVPFGRKLTGVAKCLCPDIGTLFSAPFCDLRRNEPQLLAYCNRHHAPGDGGCFGGHAKQVRRRPGITVFIDCDATEVIVELNGRLKRIGQVKTPLAMTGAG